MLTPQFKITQSQDHIIVVIRVPYVKISSCQFYIEQNSFKFYIKPYLLSLNFQQCLEQAQQPAKATYYHEKYLLQVHLNKKTKGEHFQNLNLLSKIMNKSEQKTKDKKLKNKKVLIETISQSSVVQDNGNQNVDEKGVVNQYSYGFNNNYTKIFLNLQQQSCELFSFNPEEVCIQDRYAFSCKIEKQAFDQDAYLFDKYDNQQQIHRIITTKQPEQSIQLLLKKLNQKQPQTDTQFKTLTKIPNKQLLVDKNSEQDFIKQLISISFSYIYQLVCMDGQMSVESAKTINNSSAVLNCCVAYHGVGFREVVRNSCSRCVTYSLFKSVQIGRRVLNLLINYLNKQFLLAMLLNLMTLFDKSQPRYLLNTIFIHDFFIYCSKYKIQQALSSAKKQLATIQITQSFLQLELEQQSEEEQQQNNQQMKNNQKGNAKPEKQPSQKVEQVKLIQQISGKQDKNEQQE